MNSVSRRVAGLAIVVTVVICVGGSAPLPAATGVTIEVGPATTPSTIQGALDLVTDPTKVYVIRVQRGQTFNENLVASLTSGESVAISGGWDDTFTTRTEDPTLTVIDGGGLRVVEVDLGGDAVFKLRNVTVTNGGGVEQGAGIWVDGYGTIEITDTVISNNEAVSGTGDAQGGGLFLNAGFLTAMVNGNLFVDNTVRAGVSPATPDVAGGALFAEISAIGSLEFSDNTLLRSVCRSSTTDGEAQGCGLFVQNGADVGLDISGNKILDSEVEGFGVVTGVGGYIKLWEGTNIFERNRWQGGAAIGSAGLNWALLEISVNVGTTGVIQRSSLFSGSQSWGLRVYCNHTSLFWQGVNLTAAGNAGSGIAIAGLEDATLELDNSLAFANLGDDLYLFSGTTLDSQSANIIGADPGTVNPDGGYYQLSRNSTALDAGDNAAPGGLSTLDLGGEDRVQNGTVDVGAYEGTTLIWADGFESGSHSSWSATN